MTFSEKIKKKDLKGWNTLNYKYIVFFQDTEAYKILNECYNLSEHDIVTIFSLVIETVADKYKVIPSYEMIYKAVIEKMSHIKEIKDAD